MKNCTEFYLNILINNGRRRHSALLHIYANHSNELLSPVLKKIHKTFYDFNLQPTAEIFVALKNVNKQTSFGTLAFHQFIHHIQSNKLLSSVSWTKSLFILLGLLSSTSSENNNQNEHFEYEVNLKIVHNHQINSVFDCLFLKHIEYRTHS